jgi:hypothetical protein
VLVGNIYPLLYYTKIYFFKQLHFKKHLLIGSPLPTICFHPNRPLSSNLKPWPKNLNQTNVILMHIFAVENVKHYWIAISKVINLSCACLELFKHYWITSFSCWLIDLVGDHKTNIGIVVFILSFFQRRNIEAILYVTSCFKCGFRK